MLSRCWDISFSGTLKCDKGYVIAKDIADAGEKEIFGLNANQLGQYIGSSSQAHGGEDWWEITHSVVRKTS